MSPSKNTSETNPPLNHPTLGIIGCGNIGGRQAANFIAHGYSVYVYDINLDRMIGLESCLLYTSPSPRDRSLSRMPSSA